MTKHLGISAAIHEALDQHGFHSRNRLGEGSYGEVVKAKCQEDGKLYAIKIVPLLNDERAKYNTRELDFLKGLELSERNVIKYYASWIVLVDNIQRLCIQMELCATNLGSFIYENVMGGPEIIKAHGPPRFYQQVFPQILRGLIFIHDEIGWVHRDIHPGNILIANPNPEQIIDITVKIADFGLAREIRSILNAESSTLTLTDGVNLESLKLSLDVGNELFRAPELFTTPDHGTPCYDYKVDLYSAGIVLYFISRYLREKEEWNDEIIAFKKGKRRSEVLGHQDDKHLVHLIQLLMKKPENRPTAKKALEIAGKLGKYSQEPAESSQEPVESSQEPVESSQEPVESSQEPVESSQEPVESSQEPVESSQEPVESSQEPVESSQEPVESQVLVEPEENAESTVDGKSNRKNFFIKKKGDTNWNRCGIEDDILNLPSLKAAIEHRIQVKVKSLCQTMPQDGTEKVINITSDEDVQQMFQSADKKRKQIYIIVSEKKSASEHSTEATASEEKEAKFYIKKADETAWNRWSAKGRALTISNLETAIERFSNIKPESQQLLQKKTMEDGTQECIKITFRQDFEEMFQSAEDSGKKIYIIVSEKPTAVVPEEKKFFVTKDGETAFDRCSLKSDNLSLSGLREAIECCLNVELKSKKLVQMTTLTDGTQREINIKSDKNVQEMFQSANEKGNKPCVIVLDEKLDMYT